MTALVFLLLAVFVVAALVLVPGRLGRLRYAAIVVAPFLCFLLYAAVHAYQGWPVDGAPPAGGVLVAGSVDEPHAIYLWVIPKGSARPRAYREPYSDALYGQLLQAEQAQHHGQQVEIAKPKRKGHGGGNARLPAFMLRRYRLPPATGTLKP